MEDLMLEHAGRRERKLDEHMFELGASSFGGQRTARVQLFTSPTLHRPVVMVTQTAAEGASLINAAESHVEEIWRRLCPLDLEPPLFVAQMLLDHTVGDLKPQLIEFEVTGKFEVARPPLWGPMLTAAQLERLVGQPVDLTRGDGYVEPVHEPEPQLKYCVVDVAQMPIPDLDGEPACMPSPGGVLNAVVAWWQRRGSRCCRYHAGDWAAASEAAVRALAAAQTVTPDPDDDLHTAVMMAAIDHLEREQLDGWTLKAARSLFMDPVQAHSDAPHFVNGRHRTRAMQDQRVPRTVVATYEEQAL